MVMVNYNVMKMVNVMDIPLCQCCSYYNVGVNSINFFIWRRTPSPHGNMVPASPIGTSGETSYYLKILSKGIKPFWVRISGLVGMMWFEPGLVEDCANKWFSCQN